MPFNERSSRCIQCNYLEGLAMKSHIVRIGNSQGIRIPKAVLEQTRLNGEVELSSRKDAAVIRPIRQARAGWEEAFATARYLAATPNSRISRLSPTTLTRRSGNGGEALRRLSDRFRTDSWCRDTKDTSLPGRLAGRIEPSSSHGHHCTDDDEGTYLSDPRPMPSLKGKDGQVVLDQIRTVDNKRLVKKLRRSIRRPRRRSSTYCRRCFRRDEYRE